MTHGTLRHVPSATVKASFWLLKAKPYVMIKAKRVFPRANPTREGFVLLYDTPEVARDLEWLIQRYPLDLDAEAQARLTERADEHRATERTVEEILSGNRAHLEFRDPARPARDYQLTAADLVLTTGRLLLTDDLGLGKSMSSILVLREPAALPALVVCLAHLPSQWEDELRLTLPWLRAHTVRKLKPYEIAKHRSMGGHDPDVIIIPYSKLRGWGDYLAGRINTVIFDEMQELRRRDTQKWISAAQIADGASFRMGLTATPVYNYAGETHTLMEVLAPGALGSRDEFIREWGGGSTYSSNGDHVSVADPGAFGEYLRDQGLLLRRTRKDVGRELPEVTRVPHTVDSDSDLLDALIEDAVDLAEVIVSRQAPRQELWHAHGEFDWRMRRATGLAKAPWVAEFVKLLLEAEEKVVLFGWHRDVYEVWREKLADAKPVFYTGTESPTQKRASRDAFISGDSRVLIMSLRSGAGLDGLQEACHVAVFGELDWSPGMHDQCIGRLHRDGMGDEPVIAYFLVSEEGADPVMAEVLNLKRMQSEPMLDPDAKLFAPLGDTSDRVRRLAQDVIAKRRARGLVTS